MNRPNFFIVGAPKCGTTAMNDYLQQHPDIFMAPKELHFFGADIKPKVRPIEREYIEYFQNAGNKKILGEASVWYLFSEMAASEIKKFSPDAYILIMLRNPVDAMRSLHSQRLYDGNENVSDFEKAVGFDEQRKKGILIQDYLDYYELPGYKENYMYSNQVKRYLDTFGNQKVHIILYEDFSANTKKTVEETLLFLQVEPRLKIDFKVINQNKQIKSMYLHQLIKKPPKNLRRFARVILPFKQLRHVLMANIFKKNVQEKKREEKYSHFDVFLKEFFSEDIKLLAKMINRDLSNWLI